MFSFLIFLHKKENVLSIDFQFFEWFSMSLLCCWFLFELNVIRFMVFESFFFLNFFLIFFYTFQFFFLHWLILHCSIVCVSLLLTCLRCWAGTKTRVRPTSTKSFLLLALKVCFFFLSNFFFLLIFFIFSSLFFVFQKPLFFRFVTNIVWFFCVCF